MKRLVASLALALMAAVPATPVLAQGFYVDPGLRGRFHRGMGGNVNAQQARILARIEANRRSGRLTVGEYTRLRAAFNNIVAMENQMRVNGLNFRERQILNSRLQNLRDRLYRQTYDNQFAGRTWGWWY